MSYPTRVDFTTPAFKVVRDMGRPRPYYWVERPEAVTVVAVLDGQVALVAQERPAVMGRWAKAQLLELPAGRVDHGESPEACAKRELREEVGYAAGRILKVGEFFMSPGYSDERMHLFYASELSYDPLMADEGEDLTVSWADADTLQMYITNGAVCDAKSIIGILGFLKSPGLHGRKMVI